MAVSVGWPKQDEKRMLTYYVNMEYKKQFSAAEELFERSREVHNKSLLFNYDDLACFSLGWKHKLPEYSGILRPWLEGHTL